MGLGRKFGLFIYIVAGAKYLHTTSDLLAFNMALRLCQIQYGTTGRILFSISGRQEMSVKSKKRHFWKNWNEWNSNPGGLKTRGVKRAS